MLLLRDTLLLVGQNLGMDEARTCEPVHGVGKLRELGEVAEIAHQLQAVVVAQAHDVGLRGEPECARAQQHARLHPCATRRRHAAQIARVGQALEIDAAPARPRPVGGALRQLNVVGQLIAPEIDAHVSPSRIDVPLPLCQTRSGGQTARGHSAQMRHRRRRPSGAAADEPAPPHRHRSSPRRPIRSAHAQARSARTCSSQARGVRRQRLASAMPAGRVPRARPAASRPRDSYAGAETCSPRRTC